MRIQVKINVKGITKRKQSIHQVLYEYSASSMTVEEFLKETVSQNIADYKNRRENAEILKLFSKETLDAQALEGKVTGSELLDERIPDLSEAIFNAVQCFKDGMFAIFIDGKRYEELTEQITFQKQSEVTLIRLTFLAGRLW